MKTRIIIFLCALMMCTVSSTLAATPSVNNIVAQPTLLSIAKDGEISKKEARKQYKIEKIKGDTAYTSMRRHSVIGIGICVISILLFYKQAKKRNLLKSFIFNYVLLLAIFINNLFFINVIRYVYPASFYLALFYPISFLDNKFIIGLWRFFCAVCFLFLTLTSLGLVDLGVGLVRMIIYFSLNVGLFWLLSLPTSRCPHCNYYANHDHLKREYVGEEDVVEDEVRDTSYETTHYEGKTKIITKHIRKQHDYIKYNYKYYVDTYRCLQCGEEFKKHDYSKKEIGRV